jgi:hypothetical protein
VSASAASYPCLHSLSLTEQHEGWYFSKISSKLSTQVT